MLPQPPIYSLYPPLLTQPVHVSACTVLISLVDQLAEVNNQTIIEAFDSFCVMLPPKLGNPCQLFAEIFGPLIIQM